MKFPAKQAWLAGRVAFAAVFAASCLTSLAQDVPHNYLRPGQPEIAVLPPPPLSGSAEDAADMAQVVAVHKSSPSNEVAVALSESKFSVFTFTPAVGAFFQQE